MNYEKIYLKMPVFIQHLAVSLVGLKIKHRRYGRFFFNTLKQIETKCLANREEIDSFTLQQIKKLMLDSCENVPYYRELFRRLNISPDKIKTIDDFVKRVPILQKSDILEDPTRFISDRYRSSHLIRSHTSGTTGVGLKLFEQANEESIQYAYWWRFRRWHGIDLSQWSAFFTGKPIVHPDISHPPFWRYCHPLRQVRFSPSHISDSTLPYYIEEIQKRKLAWLQGRTSAISAVASYVIENNLKLSFTPKWVTTWGELLTNQDEEKMDILRFAFLERAYFLQLSS